MNDKKLICDVQLQWEFMSVLASHLYRLELVSFFSKSPPCIIALFLHWLTIAIATDIHNIHSLNVYSLIEYKININLKAINENTYNFGIWTLSASFWRPKSCHGLDLDVGCELFNDVVGLFCPPCTLTERCILLTDTGIFPVFASNNVGAWHSSV